MGSLFRVLYLVSIRDCSLTCYRQGEARGHPSPTYSTIWKLSFRTTSLRLMFSTRLALLCSPGEVQDRVSQVLQLPLPPQVAGPRQGASFPFPRHHTADERDTVNDPTLTPSGRLIHFSTNKVSSIVLPRQGVRLTFLAAAAVTGRISSLVNHKQLGARGK